MYAYSHYVRNITTLLTSYDTIGGHDALQRQLFNYLIIASVVHNWLT